MKNIDSFMPQMSPLNWLMIFFFSLVNLLIIMILINSIFLDLILMIEFSYNLENWKWMW